MLPEFEILKNVDSILLAMHQASKIAMQYYLAKDIGLQIKKDETPVTKADIEISDLIDKSLRSIFKYLNPAPSFICEEKLFGLSLPLSDMLFITDPIDGTRDFVKKTKEFTINIGVCYKGEPIAGFVAAPAFDTCYYGILGHGAYMINDFSTSQLVDKKKISTSDKTKDLILTVSSNPKEAELITKLRNTLDISEVKVINSSLKGCLVASGVCDIYYRSCPTNEWDTAAIHGLVIAAGGFAESLANIPFSYGKIEHSFANPKSFYMANLKNDSKLSI